MKEFISPQTGSAYKVFTEVGNFKLCFREIDGQYRVRIQKDNGGPFLSQVKQKLAWGEIKKGDHLSVVVTKDRLVRTLCLALRAILETTGLEAIKF